MNGAQAGEPPGTEDQGTPTVDGAAPADAIETAGNRSDDPDVEQLWQLQLRGVLRELVPAEGQSLIAGP